jgi:hypothetical protein
MRGCLSTVIVIVTSVSFSVSSQTVQQPGGGRVPASSAITGVVTDGGTGLPLGGVIVSLKWLPTGSSPLTRITRQLTDERGRFVFVGLPAGDGYSISAAKDGYVDGAYGQRTMLGPTGKIVVRDGEWFAEADIQLWKPSAVSGRVRDEFSEPVVGLYVRVLAQQLVAGQPRLVAGPAALTDDRGEYRIANLPPGPYIVQVPSVQSSVPVDAAFMLASQDPARQLLIRQAGRPPRTDAPLEPAGGMRLLLGNYPTPPPAVDGRAQVYPPTFYPGGSEAAGAEAVSVALGEERRGIDIVLRPVAASRVSGTVHGPRDAIAGLVLRLIPVGLEDAGNGAEAATALVASNGRFTFFNVPAGTYVIDGTRAPLELTFGTGVGTTTLPQTPGSRLGGSTSDIVVSGAPGTGYIRRSGQGDDLFWTRTPVTVGPTDVADLVVTLNKSLTLEGRFVYEGTTRVTIEKIPVSMAGIGPNTQTRVTENTTPKMTPPVVAEPADGSPSLGMPRTAVSPESTLRDTFRIEGLKGGDYVLRVPAAFERLYVIKSITIGGADYTNRPIDPAAIHGRGDIVMTLTDKVITVTGVVRDEQGVTGDAAVIAFPFERDQWTRYGFTPIRIKGVAVAGKAGYQIKGLPAGQYYVVAVDAAHVTAWQDPEFLDRAAAVATRVTLAWDETRTVDLNVVRIR